jgi:Carboxypeptidase regulatory-like domain
MKKAEKVLQKPARRVLLGWMKAMVGLWVFAAAISLSGQTPTANVTGLVTDQSGGVVPGTKVTIINTATGIQSVTKTNSSGYYTIPLLQPGVYSMQVEKVGFKVIERSGIRLNVQQVARLDFTMQLGKVTQAVTVSAAPPVLQETTSSISTLVGRETVAALPMLGRNVYALVLLVPGVYAPSSYNNVPVDVNSDQYIVINGSRSGQSEYLLDGAQNTAPQTSGPVVYPIVDAVQEYRVTTTDYSAEYGRAAGGVFNVAMKTGTNALHGDAYNYLRNTSLDSNDFFSNRAGLPVDTFRLNQFGFTIGGPVRKDKTFFFAGYEGVREVQGDTFDGTVPTVAEREGDFSQAYNSTGHPITIYNPFSTTLNASGQYVRSAFPNDIVPAAMINSTAKAFAQLFPMPTSAGEEYTAANNFTSSTPQDIRKDEFVIRIDNQISDKQRIFGEFFYDRTPEVRANFYSDPLSPSFGPQMFQRREAILGDTYSLNASTIADFEASYNRVTNVRYPFSNGYNLSQLGFAAPYANEIEPSSIPALMISGFGGSESIVNSGDTFAGGDTTVIDWGTNEYALQGAVTKIAGPHTLKLGGLFMVQRPNVLQNPGCNGFTFTSAFTQGPVATAASSTAGNSFASFLLGVPVSGSFTNNAAVALQTLYYGFYGQDNFKVTRKLTLNLGLRWEYQSPFTERYNRLTNFDFQAVPPLTAPGLNLSGALSFAGVDGNPREQWNPDYDNVGPRLGFAYAVNDKTVVRAGGGLFYDPSLYTGNWTSTSGFGITNTMVASLNGVTPYNLLSNPFPNGLLKPTGTSLGAATLLGQAVTFTDRDFKTPTEAEWNLQIQRELPGHVRFAVAYIGNRGWSEYEGLDFNTLPDSDLSLGNALLNLVSNPFYGQITSGPLSKPTVAKEQLLRRFPQFEDVDANVSTWGASEFNALQITAEKRFSHGLSFTASYNWQKLMDNNTGPWPTGVTLSGTSYQDYNDLRAEWSVSSTDVPYQVIVGYIWQLPFGAGRPILKAGWPSKILGDWQMEGITTFQSGQPLGITDATNTDESEDSTQRPNWNGRNPALSNPTINEWFNTSVFSQPAAFTYGSAPRLFGSLHADSMSNFDFSMIKNIPLTERFQLQFRAEFFDLFNTPQFGPPATSYGAAGFGSVGSQINNPRIIQLALKLLF